MYPLRARRAVSFRTPCRRIARDSFAPLAKEARDWTRGEPLSFKDPRAGGIGVAAFVVLTALADR